MALTDSADILFRIKGDASDAVRAFKQTDNAATDLTGSTTGLTSAFGGMINPVTAAITAITTVATVAVTATVALFKLAQSAAEYGGEIFDASQKTGVTVETLQGLKFAADQSGVSFEAVTKSVQKFTVLIGQAQMGNEKAIATLEKYGITATNVEEAMIQAVDAIASMKTETEQNAAAAEIFKDKAGNVIQVLREMNFDLPSTIQRLREMGILMSQEDAKAADEFGDQMDLLNKQLGAVGRTIGIEVMPVFNQLAKDVSDWLAKNPGEIEKWGKALNAVLRAVVQSLGLAATGFDGLFDSFTSFLNAVQAAASGGGLLAIQQIFQGYSERQAERLKKLAGVFDPATYQTAPGPQATGAGGRPTGMYDANRDKKEAEERAKEREDIASRTAAAQINILQMQLEQQLDSFEAYYEDLVKRAEDSSTDLGQLSQESANKVRVTWDETKATLDLLNKAEMNAAIQQGKLADERTLIRMKQDEREKAADKRREDALDRTAKQIQNQVRLDAEAIKKRDEERQKAEEKKQRDFMEMVKKEGEAYILKIEKENEILEILEKQNIERRKGMDAAFERLRTDAEGSGPYSSGKTGIDIFGDTALEGIMGKPMEELYDTIDNRNQLAGESFQKLGDLAVNTFQSMAEGVGSLIQQWVLYGDVGPDALRKVTAAILANLAAQAAVEAIMELARGFAALATPWTAWRAPFHFKSAALFGAVAATAAVAGRAIAGDSFKKNAGQGGAASPSGSGQGSGKGQGSVYSSFGDKAMIIEQGRNQPATRGAQVQVTISIKDKPDWFDTMFQTSVEQNGKTRQIIRDTVG